MVLKLIENVFKGDWTEFLLLETSTGRPLLLRLFQMESRVTGKCPTREGTVNRVKWSVYCVKCPFKDEHVCWIYLDRLSGGCR